jgi:hypothetical protein
MIYCEKNVSIRNTKNRPRIEYKRETHRNKEVRNLLLISRPRLAILPPTPGNIPRSAMDDHNHEEDEVEPGERTPAKRNEKVSNQDAHSNKNRERRT